MDQRIFHPIGQGAFYSERSEKFNIVYDCGTEWKNRGNKSFDSLVKESFRPEDTIDILFISHFDYDHVSKIGVLKNSVKEIRYVVLPLLSRDEKNLLLNLNRVLFPDHDFINLLESPKDFFGINTNVIEIESIEDVNDFQSSDVDEGYLNELTSYIHRSGFCLKIKGLNNWVFVPFNYKSNERKEKLIDLLENEGFDTEKLQNNSDYTLNEICQDIRLSKNKGGKKIHQIYDKLEGDINQNSMFLYSGPKNTNDKRITKNDCSSDFFFQKHLSRKIGVLQNERGCIYSGDGDLKKVDIQIAYKRFWGNIRTIQIPHHGAKKCFDNSFMKDGLFLCPISYGLKNNYSHPSVLVISSIESNNSFHIGITEEIGSKYVQNLSYRPEILCY